MTQTESYERSRQRTAAIFESLKPGNDLERPIPLRHPLLFYVGHIPTFSYLTLNRRVYQEPAINATFERLFERGIDPSLSSAPAETAKADWPSLRDIHAFVEQCDERVRSALHRAASEPAAALTNLAIGTLLEHEWMHQETLLYIVNALDHSLKITPTSDHRTAGRPVNGMRHIPAGTAHIGAASDVAFAWDNERDAHTVDCKEFWMQRYAVSNGDWLAFVAQGGPVPHFWERRGNSWMLRCTYESIPLPLSWPVYVTQRQASAYAAFYSMRLPSETEFHRAAYGDSPHRYPWGNEPPTPQHANVGFRRTDPEGVDAHPLSASAYGIEGLVGNGWEWTSTAFEPFDGFTPMPTYPQYSADFFDGEHFVCKGASPVTDLSLVRPSFRNWYYADYPYAYVKFRCVAA